MTWNYRVVRWRGGRRPQFGISAVFYRRSGKVKEWTDADLGAPVPRGKTLDDLAEDLHFMLAALDQPVLEERDGTLVPLSLPEAP